MIDLTLEKDHHDLLRMVLLSMHYGRQQRPNYSKAHKSSLGEKIHSLFIQHVHRHHEFEGSTVVDAPSIESASYHWRT